MAYDAGMLRLVLREIELAALDAKIEKIYQPASDEVTLGMRRGGETHTLLLNAGPSAPRVSLTNVPRENPAAPPMFCMLLRKHLSGGRLIRIAQLGYERAARFTFSSYDEMGYPTEKSLVAEVMGKYSNLLLTDAEDRILAVLHPVDFTTSRLRQLLPGMTYELPPAQDKTPPLEETREGFLEKFALYPPERTTEKFITETYLGTAPAVAREIARLACGKSDIAAQNADPGRTADTFLAWFARVRDFTCTPTIELDGAGSPADFAYARMTYRGGVCEEMPSFAALFDRYFAERDRIRRTRERASDLLRLLANAEARLTRKLAVLREELAETEHAEEHKRAGDLIIGSIYRLKRGDTVVSLPDYSLDPPCEVRVTLDPRRTPAECAEREYKLYRKAKRAREVLTEQIRGAEEELAYLAGVSSFLDRAETEQDLLELRLELQSAGYAGRMKSTAGAKPGRQSKPIETTTPSGYRLLIGRNNLQNEQITFRVAERDDLWFHAKDVPGSHVILICHGEEPPAEDYTFAAELAAGYSAAESGVLVAVDYTRVRHIKKPPHAKPGYVIYKTNYSAYVTPRKLK